MCSGFALDSTKTKVTLTVITIENGDETKVKATSGGTAHTDIDENLYDIVLADNTNILYNVDDLPSVLDVLLPRELSSSLSNSLRR